MRPSIFETRLALKTPVATGFSKSVASAGSQPLDLGIDDAALCPPATSKDCLTGDVSCSCKVRLTQVVLILSSFSFRDDCLTKVGCMSIACHMRYNVDIEIKKYTQVDVT